MLKWKQEKELPQIFTLMERPLSFVNSKMTAWVFQIS